MLKLTRTDGAPVYVQAIYIAFMSRGADMTYINIAGTETIWVNETPEEILNLVGGPSYVGQSYPTTTDTEQGSNDPSEPSTDSSH